jgi:hypothetical protein
MELYFEIWFENDSCSIYDIPETNRSEYLSETEIEDLRGIIYNLCKDKINTEENYMDIEEMMMDFILHKANDEQIEQFSDMQNMGLAKMTLKII